MALKAMADNNVNITAQEDARLYDYLAGQNADYVIQNVGDSLAVSSTTTSLLVTLGSGEAVVQGRHLTNTDSTGVQLTLPQNTTAYLVLRLDLSQSLGNELSFISTPSLEDDDLNNAGVPSKNGGKWYKSTIYGILHNPLYAGYVRWDGIMRPGDHGAIIDLETYEKVNGRIQV